MNIRIYINNKVLDLYDDISINFCKEFENNDSYEEKEIQYSYEIKIPATLNNNIIFGFQNELNSTRKFTQIYDAILEVKEETLFEGKMIITEIYQEYYKCNLYSPQVVSLKDLLGDSELSSISPNEIYVTTMDEMTQLNEQCVRAMNGIDEVPSVIFPYVVYGLPYTTADEVNGSYIERYGNNFQDLQYSSSTVGLGTVVPAFNVCSILRDIFKTNGYELEGNIFDNNKFKLLYQSYSGSREEYQKGLNVPYMAKLSVVYESGKGSNSPSDTLIETVVDLNEKDYRKHTFYSDLCAFNNTTTFSVQSDKYDMIDKNGVITIPQSGWYQIDCNGTLSLPTKHMISEDKKDSGIIYICGYEADGSHDSQFSIKPISDFSHASYEFHIRKGITSEGNFYGRYNTIPTCPNTIDTTTFYTDNDIDMSGILSKRMNNIKHYKNGDVVLVKDYSGMDTSDFLIGCQFGSMRVVDRHCAKDDHYKEWYPICGGKDCCSMLMRDWTQVAQQIKDSYTVIQNKYSVDKLDSLNPHYGYQQHAVLVKDNQKSYTNIINFEKKQRYEGQSDSTCSVLNKTNGSFDLHTCVWLEKGEQIVGEVIMSGLFQGTVDNGGDRKWRSGCVHTKAKYDLKVSLMSSNEEWKPSLIQPITSNITKKYTNFNQFLGNTKCNDYVNGFLQTFNCKLTKKGMNKYSIDYNILNEHTTNTVDFDNFTDIEHVSSKRIQSPSEIQLKWKIDTKERGYFLSKSDRNSELMEQLNTEYGIWDSNRDSYNLSGFSGMKVYNNLNNTNGSIKKYESIWSYTYMDFFKCIDSLTPSNNKVIKAPIIIAQQDWENNTLYSDFEGDTKKNVRLFYPQAPFIVNASNIMARNPIVYFNRGDDTVLGLLLVDNALQNLSMPNNDGKYKASSFLLDYDNSTSNSLRNAKEYDTTITDLFFSSIRTYNKYELIVKCILPTEIYKQIGKYTLAKLDDNFYKIVKIDAFPIDESKESTITLINID